MLDFRRPQSARNYLSRKEQWRVLGLVAVSAVVLLVMRQAGQEKNWRWLLPADPADEAPTPRARERHPANRDGELMAGAFLSPPERRRREVAQADAPAVSAPPGDTPPGEAAPQDAAAEDAAPSERASSETAPAETLQPAAASSETAQAEEARPAAPAAPSERPRYFPGVRPDYLKTVRDDTVHRGSEKDAWFHLFEILAKADPDELRRASVGRVGFAQLDDQPKQYRGRLVTLAGTVRGARLLEAPRNDYGIESYYLLSLQPAGGPAEPIVVYSLDLPDGFPLGNKIAADVELTGFFYKRWTYEAQDRPRVAPLVLARSVEWLPEPPKLAPQGPDLAVVGPYLLGSVLLATAAVAAWYSWSRRQAAQRRALATPAASPDLFQNLQNARLAPTPEQVVDDLARRHAADEP